MRRAVIAALGTLGLLAANAAHAESKYVEPQDMSAADRAAISASVQGYRECLQRQAAAILTKYDDSRRIADIAMQKCKDELSKIDKAMNDRHIDPGFVKGYVRMSRNRAANDMLQEVLMYKAAHAGSSASTQ